VVVGGIETRRDAVMLGHSPRICNVHILKKEANVILPVYMRLRRTIIVVTVLSCSPSGCPWLIYDFTLNRHCDSCEQQAQHVGVCIPIVRAGDTIVATLLYRASSSFGHIGHRPDLLIAPQT
jgi:hypothetical protein